MLKYIDLFCGIGSFHYSFGARSELNWTCVMSCDIDKAVKETYKTNYGKEPLDDITKIDIKTIPDYDILCAGFPCQSFSQCGKQKGFDDVRGTLFFNVMNFVEHHRPKIVILENVPGLLTNNNGKTFSKMKQTIEEAGYKIDYKIVKCSDYGLPQMRKRLFIIGYKTEFFETKSLKPSFLDFEQYKKEKTLSELFGKNFEKSIAYTIRCGGKNSPIDDKHNWDGYIVDNKEYRLTLEDCLMLQGFDKDFKLYGTKKDKWKQVGNTIPTIFTEMIGKNIQEYFKH